MVNQRTGTWEFSKQWFPWETDCPLGSCAKGLVGEGTVKPLPEFLGATAPTEEAGLRDSTFKACAVFRHFPSHTVSCPHEASSFAHPGVHALTEFRLFSGREATELSDRGLKPLKPQAEGLLLRTAFCYTVGG